MNVSLAKQQAMIEANHGMELLADYAAWIHEAGITVVAQHSTHHLSVLRRYLRAFRYLNHPKIQQAAKDTQLSFSVIIDLGAAVYPLRKHANRTDLIITLCHMVQGLTTDDALHLIKNTITSWVGNTTRKLDVACMHKHIGRDGKRVLTAALSAPLAARIDTVLHRLAEQIRQSDRSLQYDQAYAKALTQKLLGTGGDSSGEELFGPMFMIATDYRFHSDGKITTTDGALVHLRDVVDHELAPTGWAAVTGTTDESPVIPLVGAFVKVHNRFASTPQRLAAVMETLLCAWPGCDIPASKCQIHHIEAHHRGGPTTGENLTPLCKNHNGRNDDNPAKHVNGRIERDPATRRPGLRRHPGEPLEFNIHPVTAKTTIAYTHT